MYALIVKSQMTHGISSQSFFIKLISIFSMFEWRNKTLSIFPFFYYLVKMNLLVKSKWGLKILLPPCITLVLVEFIDKK